MAAIRCCVKTGTTGVAAAAADAQPAAAATAIRKQRRLVTWDEPYVRRVRQTVDRRKDSVTVAGGIIPPMAEDFMPLLGWDYVELWVGNAKQAAYFYEHAMGFSRTAYAGPETGVRDRASYVLEQGDIRLVVTSAVREESDITKHHARHGDGVKDIALTVPDATEAYRQAVQRGARGVAEPKRAGGRVRHDRDVGDRDVRRHDPHLRRPQGLHRPVQAGLRLGVVERRSAQAASGS